MTSIIVPSKFPEIFESYRASANQFAPDTEKILVRDGHDIIDPFGWTTIQAPKGPFVYSRNVNLGINQTSGDVLLTNDDINFVSPNTVEAMEKIFATHADVGILSPKIDGGVGNVAQSNVTSPVLYTEQRLAFVCVLIRRAVIDQIGLLDENFTGYGWDDVDYCRRAVLAGWKMAATADAIVRHGHDKNKASASFSRAPIDWNSSVTYYKSKWGDARFEKFQEKDTYVQPAQQTWVRTNRLIYAKDGLTTNWWDRHSR
jgi:GT2 family glycosyltransferase